MNGHPDAGEDATVLSRLQRFLILQSTRTSIAHELESAFGEQPTITDEALNRVIQLSSIGLLEVKNEVAEILAILEAKHGNECKEEIFCIKEVERLENERVKESIKGLQVGRLGNVNRETMDEQAKQDVRTAVQESDRKYVLRCPSLPVSCSLAILTGCSNWCRS